MEKKNELLLRAYLVLLVFALIAVVILWRIVNISLIEGDKWREKGNKTVKWQPIEAERGSIFAEDGSLLATSIQFFEIRMDPVAPSQKNFDKHIDSLCIYLERYADIRKTRTEWAKEIKGNRKAYFATKKKGSRSVLISRKVGYDKYNKFKNFPLFRLGKFQGGMTVERFSTREKPFSELASRTIGVDRDNADKIGIEGYYDKELSGEKVNRLMRRLSGDVWVPIYDPLDAEVKKGKDLVTTIDVKIQDVTHSALLNKLVEENALGGTAIVMEVSTGAIKAISNFSRLQNGGYGEVFNHALGTLSEPGSTFKLATALSMLNDGLVNLNTEVDVEKGHAKFYNLWMEDSEEHNLNVINLKKAFAISSNVGIAKLANKCYNSEQGQIKFYKNLETFGLTRKTGLALIGEGQPYIKDPVKNAKEWSGTTIPWMAHGYELMLTPLQILNFYNAVANDGKLMKPYLVKEIWDENILVNEIKPEVLVSIIAHKESIKKAQELLEEVVLTGTGREVKSDKYNFAGKTGTTSVSYHDKSQNKKHNASFVGYFPVESPKYSIIVVVYEPQRNYYGSKAAAPVFREIADGCFMLDSDLHKPLLDDKNAVVSVPPRSEGFSKDFEEVFSYIGFNFNKKDQARWVSADANNAHINIKEQPIKKGIVPDVRGMGLRDALYVLENMGLNVDVFGMGKVNRQSILPGTRIAGQHIEIHLN